MKVDTRMAEPISLASGLLTLVIFACNSSITLHNTVQSFKTHPKRVRDLLEELEALINVLQSLTDTVESTTNGDLSTLKLPLLRCGKACEEFGQELLKCSSRSGGNRTSFRDWAKLRYLGEDVDGFKHLLAGYKATVTIALTDACLRNTSVTAERLEEYRDLIKTATDDLEARLESIDEKLEMIFERTATDSETTELRRIKEERLSTQKCLLICAQLSEHITQIQPMRRQGSENTSLDSCFLPERITGNGIQECKMSLDQTTEKLEKHMQDLIDRLIAKSNTVVTQEEVADLARLREDWTTARQCRAICTQADKHLKENISIIDNHATGDQTVQFLVSTSDKTIHGKNRGYGFKIRQIGGHLSDESVQQLSRDISRISMENPEKERLPSQDNITSTFDDADEKRVSWQNYGNGRKLVPHSGVDKAANSKPSNEGGLSSSRGRPGAGL